MNGSLTFLARKIAPYLAESEAIPLFGHAPIFDWKKYGSHLAARFSTENFSIDLKDQEWKGSKDVTKGLGANPSIAPILLSPIASPVFWVMSSVDVKSFASAMLTGTKSSKLQSEALQEGYFRYLLLEALDAAKEMEPVSQLTPQFAEESALPDEKAFCIDVAITVNRVKCWGRLVIPESTRGDWVRHFAHLPYAPVASDRAREIELLIGVQAGLFQIDLASWKKLRAGDAVLLDRSSY